MNKVIDLRIISKSSSLATVLVCQSSARQRLAPPPIPQVSYVVYAHVRDVKCYMRLEVVVTDAGRTDGRTDAVESLFRTINDAPRQYLCPAASPTAVSPSVLAAISSQ